MLDQNIRLLKVSCERTELHPYLAMTQQYVHKSLLQKCKYVIRTNGSFLRENAGCSVLIWCDTMVSLAHIIENGKHPLKRNTTLDFAIMFTNSIVFTMKRIVSIK